MTRNALNLALGVVVWGAVLSVSLIYELRRGMWLQGSASIVALAFLAYVAVSSVWNGVQNKESGFENRGRYLVGDSATPRNLGTKILVGACIATTVIGWMLPHSWYVNEGAVSRDAVLVHHEWWRLITSAFLHVNVAHLWFNMAALWVLGEQLETMLGSAPLAYIYAASALGGGIAVVAFGQGPTIGASGAIYGLLGASTLFACKTWRHGFRETGKRMLLASAIVVFVNLLLSAAIPIISIAAHIGGLITGFLTAMLVGVPSKVRTAWTLTDQAPRGVHYTWDANGRLFYNGPARYPLEQGWIAGGDIATAVDKDVLPQVVIVEYADPDELLIACPIPDTAALITQS